MNVLRSLLHPYEVASLIDFMLLGGKDRIFPANDLSETTPSMVACYKWLDKTSRSFAAVIQALNPELRPVICLFYLILRALDTVEDDMSIPLDTKVALLRNFHKSIYQSGWSFDGSGPKEKDRGLLLDFAVVVAEFRNLSPKYQQPIADITKKMGNGMADFATMGDVQTTKEYNLYCHYVAGLVGIGLSKLFAASGLEAAEVGEDEECANSMGLFLQKTNIIRDYLEDLQDGRTWWPTEIWSKYTNSLSQLAQPTSSKEAVACLNHLITDALRHVPDVFKYMSRLRDQTVFNFCAIPQTMAIATLARCYNNPKVFSGVVKIRKGQAVSLMLEGTSMSNLYVIFDRFSRQLRSKVPSADPNAPKTHDALDVIDRFLLERRELGLMPAMPEYQAVNKVLRMLLVLGVVTAIYWKSVQSS